MVLGYSSNGCAVMFTLPFCPACEKGQTKMSAPCSALQSDVSNLCVALEIAQRGANTGADLEIMAKLLQR